MSQSSFFKVKLMKSIKRIAFLAFLFSTASGALSPAFAQSAADLARRAANPAGQQKSAQSPELRARIEKSNAFITLMNRTIRISDAWARYTSWVNVKTGPTGKERYIVYGIYSVYDVRSELEKARAAADAQPSIPELDAAIKSYAASVEAVSPIINRTSGYYDRKDYTGDNLVEGKELHAKLMPAMETFLAESAKLNAVFRPFKNDLDQQELAAIEAAEGKKDRWHAKNVLIRAKNVIEFLPTGSKPIVEMKAFEEALGFYGSAVKDFDNFVLENPGTRSLSNASSLLGRLRDLREKLVKAKGDVRVAARNDMMLAQGVALNMMVQDYNSMIQMEQAWSR
jgi:hypothetical protein